MEFVGVTVQRNRDVLDDGSEALQRANGPSARIIVLRVGYLRPGKTFPNYPDPKPSQTLGQGFRVRTRQRREVALSGVCLRWAGYHVEKLRNVTRLARQHTDVVQGKLEREGAGVGYEPKGGLEPA